MTRGLPGSGKSTWAGAWVAADPSNRVRVNRDDIRFMLYGKYWGVDEEQVSKVETAAVKAALAAGKDVVIDATHLKAAYVKKWAALGDIEVKSFPVPVETAVERDRLRALAGGRAVGADVIRGLAKRYHVPADGRLPKIDLEGVGKAFEFKPYVRGNTVAYSFDIDGTLALMNGRGPYETSRYHEDLPNRPIVNLMWGLRQGDPEACLIGLSGRSEEFKDVTLEWAAGWGIYLDALFMRPAGDTRNDAIVKSELVDEHISGVYDVIVHFDDRNRVVDALRGKGMTVAQVAPGDF